MICSILSVGTELLLGQINDTNSTYISSCLGDAGVFCYEHRKVGDNEQRLTNAIESMLSESDAIIISGGLGPTHDDITREVVAKLMNVDLVFNEDIAGIIHERFVKRKIEMPENNLRQAYVPQGVKIIENNLGTAPGLICIVNHKGNKKRIYLVPGVPHEMKPMVNDVIIPDLLSNITSKKKLTHRIIKTWRLPESELAARLNELVEKGETGRVKIGFLARGINGIWVKLSIATEEDEDPWEFINEVESEVKEILNEYIYAYDDETMASVVTDLLKDSSRTLSICESFTGGMVSSLIVDVPGTSEVLKGSMVSYDEKIKHKIVGVSAEDVYSHECAQQMAQGVLKMFDADIAISTTGLAGPDAQDGHEVGEVYIGIASIDGASSRQFSLLGDRQRIREYGSITALDVLRRFLLGLSDDLG
ncbi:MAG: competence/damage-inducible protein A [Acidimicrobiia bacterium]